MSVAQFIDDTIDDWVIDTRPAWDIQHKHYYSPSKIHYCYRWQHFDKALTKPYDITLTRKGLIGDLIHKYYILPALREKLWPDAHEIKTERDLTLIVDLERRIFIHGRADQLLHLKDPKLGAFVVDVKSIANLFALQSDITNYKMQLMPYFVGLKVETGFIVFVSRSTGAHRTYKVDYDHDIMKEVVNRVLTSHTHFEKEEMPPAEGLTNPRFRKNMKGGKIKFWHCSYCPWSKECTIFEEALREAAESQVHDDRAYADSTPYPLRGSNADPDLASNKESNADER